MVAAKKRQSKNYSKGMKDTDTKKWRRMLFESSFMP